MPKEHGTPSHPDYSALDIPAVIDHVFYPKKIWYPPRHGAQDFMIPVEEDVALSARYYEGPPDSPTILYFHGNGEIAWHYDQVAGLYSQIGTNLFVTDYRGYGKSDGSPSFATMVADANKTFEFLQRKMQADGVEPKIFVMGRSLGCIPALEVASRSQDSLGGLIVDSGLANPSKLAKLFGFPLETARELSENVTEQVKAIKTPALVIHGFQDTIIPCEVGIELYHNLGSENKALAIIPNGNHNNLLQVARDQYFSLISDFVSGEVKAD